jgi:hypothetical protein
VTLPLAQAYHAILPPDLSGTRGGSRAAQRLLHAMIAAADTG